MLKKKKKKKKKVPQMNQRQFPLLYQVITIREIAPKKTKIYHQHIKPQL